MALPDGHRFPIAKYERIRDEIVARGLLAPTRIEEPERAERWTLELVHTPGYVDAVFAGSLTTVEVRRLGFPWSVGLRERSLRTVQGTIEAAYDALEDGLGINLAGGTHHAFPDHGEGFCVFNDVASAIRVLQRAGLVTRAAVVDLDVHQGNGTARIFADDADVFTFSMHGARNYPFRKEQSGLDVELDDGCGDGAYLAALDAHLGPVLEAARPEIVFYLGGADPFVHDRFGRLGMSVAGLAARDLRVFDAVRGRGLPCVVTMAGGYARDLEDVVTIQANTVEAALAAYA
ncbi:MAG TPA: histone deacetylase [Gemmatimonadales bacterium]|nr:histone deacetylase [Gemmatimonadales bacterium]